MEHAQAVFDGGDPCYNAPARSLTVLLECGEHERMWGGEEPETCVYTVRMSTPAACKLEDLARVSPGLCRALQI